MKKFFGVFGVVVCFVTFAFSDSTNIVGGGSVVLPGFQFSGKGDSPTNYAAKVEGATDLLVSGSSFDGGAGGSATGYASSINEDGGTGLQLLNVAYAAVSNSSFTGGAGGNIVSSACGHPDANGGYGIDSAGNFSLVLTDSLVVTGGFGGSISNGNGAAKALGGDGLHLEIQDVFGSLIFTNGLYQGGNGGNADFNSSEKEVLFQILKGNQNGARGGRGLYLFSSDMYRETARSVRVENGIFEGGNGGTATNNNQIGDVNANGGSGIFIGSVSDVQILDGTFVGGQAGTTNSVLAQEGYGATFWDSNVEISGGDFRSGGIFFSSLYYESLLSITGGLFDRVELSAVDGQYQGRTTAHISGGIFGGIRFSGTEEVGAEFSGGTVSNIYFEGTGITRISAMDSALETTLFLQKRGDVICSSNLLTGGHYTLESGQLTVSNGIPSVHHSVGFQSIERAVLSVPQADYDFSALTDSGAITFWGETVLFDEGLWQTHYTNGHSDLWMGVFPTSATVTPSQLILEAPQKNSPAPEQLLVRYDGRFPVVCAVSSDVPWIVVSPQPIFCTTGQEWVVELQFDADSLIEGDYTGHIMIVSEQTEAPVQTVGVSLHILPPCIHVSPDGNDANDGGSWATAKQTIQAAVYAAQSGVEDTIWVTNGTYRLSAEINVTEKLYIRGISAAEETIVDGDHKYRCFNLGSSASTLSGLTITNGNSSDYGGGVYCADTNSVVESCILSGNSASLRGGGMYYGTASDCAFSGNSAQDGGGMYYGMANSCIFSGNRANWHGGGIYDGTANNCTIIGNWIAFDASSGGGGMYNGTANNCVVWHNSSDDLYNTEAHFVCSRAPFVTHGVDGCITNEPMLSSLSHLSAASPCIGAGNSAYVRGADIDGELWANPPSIGCDEYSTDVSGILTLKLEIEAQPRIAQDAAVPIYCAVQGAASLFVLDFGDGTAVSNRLYITKHAWSASGTYDIVLTAFNTDYPSGLSVTQQVEIVEGEQYVSLNGNDANDGLSWGTAKRTIQAAVDEPAAFGQIVWVTNGIYRPNSEITVTNSIRIQSVNGAEVTIVNGGGSHRCFNLGASACTISGFTIANGYSSAIGGGIYCSDTNSVVEYCTFSGNSAASGGGGMGGGGTANHCTFISNWSRYGGGMYEGGGVANYCTFSSNSAYSSGGAIFRGTANNCTITDNSANYGGGIGEGTANNCVLRGNSAYRSGGGMGGGRANNCIFSDNSANSEGGGMSGGTANNCSFIANFAQENGGGMWRGTANNCIVWYNQGGDLFDMDAVRFTCSADVTHGVNGCITNEPMLVSSSHLSGTSPCIGAGSSTYAKGMDIDGEYWGNPPPMGCDEYSADASGPLVLRQKIIAPSQIAWNTTVPLCCTVLGHATLSVLDCGDGTTVSNRFRVEHAWSAPGSYDIVLTAFNANYPSGTSVTQRLEVVAWDLRVSPNGNDANNGLSWGAAKRTVQAAVDATTVFGQTVWVTNGTYRPDAEIMVNSRIQIRSVNGAEATIVDGGGINRCFNLGSSVYTVSGFTITNGHSSATGGGIYCEGTKPVIENCVITDNSTDNDGGGIYNGTVNRCIFTGNFAGSDGGGMGYGMANSCIFSRNSAERGGGGMAWGTANNCTFTDNSAIYGGGGMAWNRANNCIVWYNQGGNLYQTDARFTCSPSVVHGTGGCITNEPMLASLSHLSATSPCIGAGSSLYVEGADVDGEVWVNPPSMGCDEFNTDVSGSLTLEIDAPFYVRLGSATPISYAVQGAASLSILDFGDGTTVSNRLQVEHTWSVSGIYDIVLTAYNTEHPSGVSVSQCVEVLGGKLHVYVSPHGDDANDGLAWITAKQTIQSAVDVARSGETVWATNGIYYPSAEIVITNSIRVQSVNGAEATLVDGSHKHCCFNLGSSDSTLYGLTITNGYSGGGVYCTSTNPVAENCIFTDNSTSYHGGGMRGGTANHCTFIGNSAFYYGGGMAYGVANNCIFKNNSARSEGGGTEECVANNCTFIGNSTGGDGGGMHSSTANNCIITGNSAGNGGGMHSGTANNCIITGNSAGSGGGISRTAANNCTITWNSAISYGGGVDNRWYTGSVNNCIIWYNEGGNLYEVDVFYACSPDVVHGTDGCITNEPAFVDHAGNDFHLQPGSPCIDAGINTNAAGTVDLDGNPRIINEVVDMGAYEFFDEDGDFDADGLSNGWEDRYFGNITSAEKDGNPDGDGSPNSDEFIAGTDPTNSASYFQVSTGTTEVEGEVRFIIEWTAVTGRVYNVLWTPSLTQEFHPLETGIAYPQSSYTDTVHSAESSGFYRVVVMRADYDADGDGLPNDWEAQYAVADAMADGDGDGFDNLSEFIAGTDPTNGTSFFATASSFAEVSGTDCFVVEWISIPDRIYSVQWSTNLVDGFQALENNIEFPQSSYTDTSHNAETESFYKVDVRLK